MTLLPHLLARPDTLIDIYIGLKSATIYLLFCANVGFRLLTLLSKRAFIDATFTINKLPFGQWLSLAYFVFLISFAKSLISGGELFRICCRAFRIYFIDRLAWSECISRFRQYLWTIGNSRLEQAEQLAIDYAVYLWTRTGSKIVNKTTELVFEHGDEMTKTAMFTLLINGISRKISYDISEMIQTTGIASSISRIERETSHMGDEMILSRDQMHEDIKTILDIQWKETIALNGKIDKILIKLEEIRSSRPEHFRQIISELAFPYAMTESINKLALLFGSTTGNEVALF